MNDRRKEVQARRAAEHVREAEINLLALMTPYGKPLGECTRAECKHMADWFAAIAEKMKESESQP